MKRLLWITFFLLMVPGTELGQQQDKKAVQIVAQTDDRVSTNVLFAFKEQIRKSAGYRLAGESEVWDKKPLSLIQVWIVSIPADEHQNSAAIAYYAVLPMPGCSADEGARGLIPFSEKIFNVGAERVDEAGRTMLADIDHDLDAFIAKLKK